MIHRRRLPGPSPDRWLISYADFITLLFAFFVVLYGVAQSRRAKTTDISDAVTRALSGGAAVVVRPAPAAAKAAIPVTAPDSVSPLTAQELAPSFARLKERLQEEIADGKMQITMGTGGIVISLHEGSFFPSGGDEIFPAAFESMAKVASIIRDLPNSLRLEGHTDSVPIHNQRFRSNWDLSAARSIAVLILFETRYGIASQRFAIAGYADNLPVAGNDSDEGRSKNRRVDIVIVATPR